MKKTITAFFLLTLFTTPVFAKVNVVATLPFIGSLAREIGGDKVDTTVLVKPTQDPHFIEAKPSMILAAKKADILMYNGLDLEVGYLPLIISSSRNGRIQPGQKGNLDCSQFISPIERAHADIDRSMGDVHPLGNPHYVYSPKDISRVAEGMADALSAIDPGNEAFYKDRLSSFKDKLNKKESGWEKRQLKRKRFIAYHNLFSYLASSFGFQVTGFIEPKPGIPPSAGHIEKLIEAMKREKPDAIIITDDAGKKEAEFLSQKTGVKTVVLPRDVGSTPSTDDWFSLIDEILTLLEGK